MDDIQMGDIPEGGNKITTWAVSLLAVFVIVAAAAFLIYRWLNPNTKYNSSSEVAEYSNYLSCSAKAVKEPFFAADGATSAEHKIKIVFENGRVDKLSYTYEATLATAEAAEKASSNMHARYNIYMGEHEQNAEGLVPSFNAVEDKAVVALNGTKSTVNSATAPMFLLSSDEAMKFATLSSDEIAKIYNTRGLSCVLYE